MTDSGFRSVSNFPDYAVSAFGEIARVKASRRGTVTGLPLKSRIDRYGYCKVTLYNAGRKWSASVHGIVAEAFHGKRPGPNLQVAHCDGNPLNNRADNLRWATCAENAADKRVHGTLPSGSRHYAARLSWDDVLYIRASPKTWGSGVRLARLFGVSTSTISEVRKGSTWLDNAKEAR